MKDVEDYEKRLEEIKRIYSAPERAVSLTCKMLDLDEIPPTPIKLGSYIQLDGKDEKLYVVSIEYRSRELDDQ